MLRLRTFSLKWLSKTTKSETENDMINGTRPAAGEYIVDAKVARTTGALVAVLNLSVEGAVIEKGPDGEAWAAQCCEHGWVIWTPNRREAHAGATRPEEWCDECADETSVDVDLEFEVSA